MSKGQPHNQTSDAEAANKAARDAAVAKMKAAIQADKKGEEVVVEHQTLDSSSQANQSSPSGAAENSRLLERVQRGETGTIAKVKVYSPFRTYFDDTAMSISAENLTGPFDILAGHKNFMTLLTACDVVVRSQRGEERISIDRGIMHVHNNQVTVFLDV